MLLTSSQVSVLLTTGIVLLCTSALFISGCLIQQRTLRDLRTAIRPAHVTRPKPKSWDTEALKRTKTTIRLEDGTLVEIQSRPDSDPNPESPPPDLPSAPETIEVRPTIPEVVEVLEQKPLIARSQDDGVADGSEDEDDESAWKVNPSPNPSWDGVQEGGKPLTPVERRRRIKAEIQRLSRGDTPVYYQRRLW
ncbi:hypothetical protein F4678DRAFT_444518 [Xylaria arbuscula]|nr:hypothetical protein F4678DRAFT_444518 [Xylaria arbuscula]